MNTIKTPLLPDLFLDRVFDQVFVGRGTYLYETRFRFFVNEERVIIGRYSSIAEDVWISAGGNHRPNLPSTWPFDSWIAGLHNPNRSYRVLDRHTEIGSDVWICDRAIIGGGVTVGHGAVVGAGAVVYRDVPPYAIVAGNPAKIIRYRFTRMQRRQLLELRWWDWTPDEIQNRLEWFYMPIEQFLENCSKDGLLPQRVSLRRLAARFLKT